jgi:hypothetical protein
MKVIEIPSPEALPAVLDLSLEVFEREAKMGLAVNRFEL